MGWAVCYVGRHTPRGCWSEGSVRSPRQPEAILCLEQADQMGWAGRGTQRTRSTYLPWSSAAYTSRARVPAKGVGVAGPDTAFSQGDAAIGRGRGSGEKDVPEWLRPLSAPLRCCMGRRPGCRASRPHRSRLAARPPCEHAHMQVAAMSRRRGLPSDASSPLCAGTRWHSLVATLSRADVNHRLRTRPGKSSCGAGGALSQRRRRHTPRLARASPASATGRSGEFHRCARSSKPGLGRSWPGSMGGGTLFVSPRLFPAYYAPNGNANAAPDLPSAGLTVFKAYAGCWMLYPGLCCTQDRIVWLHARLCCVNFIYIQPPAGPTTSPVSGRNVENETTPKPCCRGRVQESRSHGNPNHGTLQRIATTIKC